jgi:hypothetical protein
LFENAICASKFTGAAHEGRPLSQLQQKMVILTLAVSLAPLLILGMVLYYQFERTGREMTREQIRYRAQAQAEAVDLFLEERTAILNVMADTHSFDATWSRRKTSCAFSRS